MRDRYGRIYLVPAVLAFAGPGFLVVATGGKFLPFAIGWWILALGVA
jgi:hypothetical protein